MKKIVTSLVMAATLAFGALNLAACEHVHSYTQWVVTEAATCTEDGLKTRTCADCGAEFTETLPKTGHDYQTIAGKTPTCTEGGLTDSVVCKTCGDVYAEQEEIAPLGHAYVNGVCERCGAAEAVYDYAAHVSETMPKISVATADGSNDWATVYFPYFDNYNPENNIDWPYRDCTVSLDNCGEEYRLDSVAAQIKVRGNWTTTYDKKPFRIKFNKKQTMAGLNDDAKYKSWVLLADYKDISMTRNSVGFYLGNQILGSDGYYCTDFRNVEVFLNGVYWGVYLLCEQQQINSGRVDINEAEEDYTGTDIGYFIEYDGYYQLEEYNQRFSCDYNGYAPLTAKNGSTVVPDQNGFTIKSDVYALEQKQFIKSYIGNLYKICYEAVYRGNYLAFNEDRSGLVPSSADNVFDTVSAVIELDSLVDTYILSEIACDYDLAWSSFLMSVDMSGTGNKKLRFEAPWDFDSAFGLRPACESARGLYAANANNPWLLVFINEDWFGDMVKAKWASIKNGGVLQGALDLILNLKNTYSDYMSANYDRWGWNAVKDKVQGEFCQAARQAGSQGEAAEYLYDWLNTRIGYLDSVWS